MFKGSIPALATPFSGGGFDADTFAAFVDWQVAQGSHGLVPCGTTGEVATLVKLIRVAMLAPAVLVISLLVRRYAENGEGEGKRPPLLPFFVIGFLFFAALNSFGLIPAVVSDTMSGLSRWALLISIAAVGMKTSLKRILDVGGQAIVLIVAETLFIALLVLAGVALLGGILIWGQSSKRTDEACS